MEVKLARLAERVETVGFFPSYFLQHLLDLTGFDMVRRDFGFQWRLCVSVTLEVGLSNLDIQSFVKHETGVWLSLLDTLQVEYSLKNN